MPTINESSNAKESRLFRAPSTRARWQPGSFWWSSLPSLYLLVQMDPGFPRIRLSLSATPSRIILSFFFSPQPLSCLEARKCCSFSFFRHWRGLCFFRSPFYPTKARKAGAARQFRDLPWSLLFSPLGCSLPPRLPLLGLLLC